ncbi:hypothetical protein I4U23_013059 [Adineta vaga]|nr:hypothetical protein I4U23_013059 [Adineta vaga]
MLSVRNLFIILLLVSSITLSHTYRCFQCMSTQEPACGNSFDPSARGIKIVEAKADELCWATRIGNTFGRAVMLTEMCSWGKDKCVTAFIDDATVTYCCCTSDLCNTQNMPQNTTTTTVRDHLLFERELLTEKL